MTTLIRPRRSTSTASQIRPEATSIQNALSELRALFSATDDTDASQEQIKSYLEQVQVVKDALRPESLSKEQDAFRIFNGFRLVLDLFGYCSTTAAQNSHKAFCANLLLQTLSLLRAAMKDHAVNRKHFSRRMYRGGWRSLSDWLEHYLNLACHDKAVLAKIFGELLACAVEDEALVELLENLQAVEDTQDTPGNLFKIVKSTIPACTIIHNPEVFPILLILWSNHASRELPNLPLVLRTVYTSCTRNLVAVHEAGMLTKILNLIKDAKHQEASLAELQDGTMELLKLGVLQLDDAQVLYGGASSSPRIADILDKALHTSDGVPFVHFDTSLHGFSCIELPDLGKPFPPPSNVSAGYTIAFWFQVLSFDQESHLTLFGAFDPSRTCFLLVYLEKESKNVILQTSVTASRPSIRFKSYDFQLGKWYYMCIIHRRPSMTSSSRASLFVDGEFVEQVKAHFPSPPPAEPPTVASSSCRANTVKAFLGTPKDLASSLESGHSSAQWRLASACLFGEALRDDLIAVYHELGPRYHGNYQDALGSFQTYEASAAINLRNETLHPGKEEKSTMVSAIRSKAGNLMPESRILLNISPRNIFKDDSDWSDDQSLFEKSLSRDALRNLRHWTRNKQTTIAVNSAVPSINKALVNLSGVAFLYGDPVVISTQALDDATWRLGGCLPIGLSLLDAAKTKQDVNRALDIFFATIKGSWRNSEAMEKENGFSILGCILLTKLPKLIDIDVSERTSQGDKDEILFDILMKILVFIGYEPENPENSVINNPLAYRVLLVDLDIWRSASLQVQRLYYEQFTVFSIGSKHHLFNSRRMARMRITKKWLNALKSDTFSSETLGYFLTAFRSLLNNALTADAHRSIAQYITYAVHHIKDRTNQLQHSKSIAKASTPFGSILRRSTAPIEADPFNHSHSSLDQVLSRRDIGIRVLEMYAELLCQRDTTNIKRFAKIVTNKWLLYLITEDNRQIISLSTKILAKVLRTSGKGYVDKFADKSGGFVIMQYRLKKWWYVPDLWLACFAILFDMDITSVNLRKSLDLYSMLSNFPLADIKIVYTGIIPVIVAMLQGGLKSILQNLPESESPLAHVFQSGHARSRSNGETAVMRNRALSLQPPGPSGVNDAPTNLSENSKLIQTMTRFLAELQIHSANFKIWATSSIYEQELLFLLFPLIVSSDIVSAETELNSRDSALTFDGHDVVIRPLSRPSQRAAPIVRTTFVEGTPSPDSTRPKGLKSRSSYVLITSEEPRSLPSPARLESIASPKKGKSVRMNISHSLVQEVLELIVAIFTDAILYRKEFMGLGLFMKVPPGFQEHQAYFQSFLLRNTISSLESQLKLDQKLLTEPRVLTNLQKLCNHLDEAVFEGWFIEGSEPVIDFLGELLEHLQRSDIKQLKSVRLCSEVINSMRTTISRLVLLRLSENDKSPGEARTTHFLKRLTYWQTVILSTDATQEEFLKLLCYLLYTKLASIQPQVQERAADLWRTLLIQKPQETGDLFQQLVSGNDNEITQGFQKLLEVDNVTFLVWIGEHRSELDAMFIGRLTSAWENFTSSENKTTESNFKSRVSKRREKLRLWVNETLTQDDVLRRHEITAEHWKANIYTAEHVKRQRVLQDQLDGQLFNIATWKNMLKDLYRPCGLLYNGESFKSKIDMTEGRNRMRLRLLPDQDTQKEDYKPKRAASKVKRPMDIKVKATSAESSLAPSPTLNGFNQTANVVNDNSSHSSLQVSATVDNEPDDDFEIVDEPELESDENKNRKVMRSLQRGDTVEFVHNISRIAGLEAYEGLLIIGKYAFYMMDHYFQRPDGEIVDVWQAPPDERDKYLQMISGQSGELSLAKSMDNTHETRSWRWEDVLSISKRRFLFRDVGIEVFFLDGESYLLTLATPKLRDEVYQRLMSKAQSMSNGLSSTNPEDMWRVESLRSIEDSPKSLGAKFTNVFTQGTANPATKKWLKGEISNFQYLMIVNTMAGRTFNDLTQYPVFPWVLADYTSKYLDLTNPRSFRDLTKPMGAQTPERQAEFNERYLSFAEMGNENAPPFHYGTHYSTSMIVTGYLIRLQPFVQSYLLLQGGVFDHPDRLFYSIEKAWMSASRENMTDVRELIPEFFYLPEMFKNGNGYDFGKRQGDGGGIDNVVLPPWANGDPHIFIAKHREALESDYVSKHLHQWIDLIFGHKQRGEAALEATNVFHHLSYRGAKDLDTITDAKDREVTIQIIHNFGQTPHQVFHRPHPAREVFSSPTRRLDNAAEMLTLLPSPLLGLSTSFLQDLYNDFFRNKSKYSISDVLTSSRACSNIRADTPVHSSQFRQVC